MKFNKQFKIKEPDEHDHEGIEILFVENASTEAIYDFLKTRSIDNCYTSKNEYVDQYILSKNEPLLNSGLAKFSIDEEVLKFIYEEGDNRLKKLVLAGPLFSSISYNNEWENNTISNLIKDKENRLFVHLFSSKNLSIKYLEYFFRKKECFKDISNDYWVTLFSLIVPNIVFLEKPLRDYWEYHDEDENIFNNFWEMFDEYPKEEESLDNNIKIIETLGYYCDRIKKQYILNDYNKVTHPRIDFKKTILKWEKVKNIKEYKDVYIIPYIIEELNHFEKFKDIEYRTEQYKNDEQYIWKVTSEEEKLFMVHKDQNKLINKIDEQENKIKYIKDLIFDLGQSLRDNQDSIDVLISNKEKYMKINPFQFIFIIVLLILILFK